MTVTDVVEDITIPDTPEGLEEFLADRKNLVALLKKPGGFEEFLAKYGKHVLDKQVDMAEQIRNETQKGIAEWLRANKEEGFTPVNLQPKQAAWDGIAPLRSTKASVRAGLYNKAAMGAVLDKEFDGPSGAAEFFQLVYRDKTRTANAKDQAQINRIRNAFSSEIPSEGGFLIPENLRSDLLMVALETAIMRPRAQVVPMETLRVPYPAVDSTSNVSSVFGGIVAYWTEEGAALTASSATFSRIVLEAKKLTAYSEIPNELLADSVGSFQAFLQNAFPQALAFYEDLAFMKGSGVGEPLGIFDANNAATVVVTKESGQAADTIVWENVVKMFARMLPTSLNRAIWVASPDTLPELATMALSVGTGGSAVWLTNGAEGPPVTILGRPVIFSEKTPGLLGDQGDLSFVDPMFYLIGDRQAMSASTSEHYKFGNDVTAFKVIERVDGRPWLQSAITPQNNGPALSPYVQLAARA